MLQNVAKIDPKIDPKLIENCSGNRQKLILSKPPKSKIHWKTYRFFNMFENYKKKTTMTLKHMDLEAILRPFWSHLGVLGKDPFGSMLGCFRDQVAGLGFKLEVWEALLGSISCRVQVAQGR